MLVFNETAGSFRRSEARRVPLASPRGFFVLSRFAAQFTTKELLYPLRRRIRCFDQLARNKTRYEPMPAIRCIVINEKIVGTPSGGFFMAS